MKRNYRGNVRCDRIYPIEKTNPPSKKVSELITIGMKLSKRQAFGLIKSLLFAVQNSEQIEIVGYRFEKRRSDGTYRVTITGKS